MNALSTRATKRLVTILGVQGEYPQGGGYRDWIKTIIPGPSFFFAPLLLLANTPDSCHTNNYLSVLPLLVCTLF